MHLHVHGLQLSFSLFFIWCAKYLMFCLLSAVYYCDEERAPPEAKLKIKMKNKNNYNHERKRENESSCIQSKGIALSFTFHQFSPSMHVCLVWLCIVRIKRSIYDMMNCIHTCRIEHDTVKWACKTRAANTNHNRQAHHIKININK